MVCGGDAHVFLYLDCSFEPAALVECIESDGGLSTTEPEQEALATLTFRQDVDICCT